MLTGLCTDSVLTWTGRVFFQDLYRMQNFLSDSWGSYEGGSVCLHLSEQSCCWKPSAICCGHSWKGWGLWLAKLSGPKAMEESWDDISHCQAHSFTVAPLIKALGVSGIPAGATWRWSVALWSTSATTALLTAAEYGECQGECFVSGMGQGRCRVIPITLQGNAVFELSFITLLCFYLQNHFRLW